MPHIDRHTLGLLVGLAALGSAFLILLVIGFQPALPPGQLIEEGNTPTPRTASIDSSGTLLSRHLPQESQRLPEPNRPNTPNPGQSSPDSYTYEKNPRRESRSSSGSGSSGERRASHPPAPVMVAGADSPSPPTAGGQVTPAPASPPANEPPAIPTLALSPPSETTNTPSNQTGSSNPTGNQSINPGGTPSGPLNTGENPSLGQTTTPLANLFTFTETAPGSAQPLDIPSDDQRLMKTIPSSILRFLEGPVLALRGYGDRVIHLRIPKNATVIDARFEVTAQ